MNANSVTRLGAAIRQRRLDLDWTQQRLADAIRVSRQWVSAFENGKETAELGAALRAIRTLGLIVDLIEAPDTGIDLGNLGHVEGC